jgi:hypothetical protein
MTYIKNFTKKIKNFPKKRFLIKIINFPKKYKIFPKNSHKKFSQKNENRPQKKESQPQNLPKKRIWLKKVFYLWEFFFTYLRTKFLFLGKFSISLGEFFVEIF